MINTLDDYIWRSLPEQSSFTTNPNLGIKVNSAGKFLPFRGNTVIFRLAEDTKQALRRLQTSLYQSAPDMLAEKLDPDTFHMTLHDLVNGCPDDPTLDARMTEAEKQAQAVLSECELVGPLRMKATWLFNMVNTSIVLGLAPRDEDSWRMLDQMYTAFETVTPLGYALSPHITVAYFRPGTYDQEQVQHLRSALHKVDMDVVLSKDDLALQYFSDMNSYIDKVRLQPENDS